MHQKSCDFPADIGDKVLDLCQRNVERNLSELDVTGNVFVRELEWTKPCQSSSRYPTGKEFIYSAFDMCHSSKSIFIYV